MVTLSIGCPVCDCRLMETLEQLENLVYLELSDLLRLPDNLDGSRLASRPDLTLELGAAISSADAFQAAVRATALSNLTIEKTLNNGAVSSCTTVVPLISLTF